MDYCNSTYVETVKLADFFFIVMQILSYADIINTEMFCYGDVLFRRRFVTETLCYGDVLHGDVLSRRRFVEETFCAETFCMCAADSILNMYLIYPCEYCRYFLCFLPRGRQRKRKICFCKFVLS
jgi:hypothetical protein